MTADFDRTAHCQCNHHYLTEIQRILTEHYWLCFDRTTSLTEHLGKLGFDRTVNGEMFCQKMQFVFCHTPFHFLCIVLTVDTPKYKHKNMKKENPDILGFHLFF